MKIHSEQEMLDYGKSFTPETNVIELVGDVGAGKTTFVRGLAEKLGVEEPVTSPSFTISKSYATKDGRTLTHYDFYRLGDPGLMVDDLAENIDDKNQLVVIEWGETVENLLPKDRTIINITLADDGSREVTISTNPQDPVANTPQEETIK